MKKSIFEEYCEREQPKKLQQLPKPRVLRETLEYIDSCPFSNTIISGMNSIVEYLYGLDLERKDLLFNSIYQLPCTKHLEDVVKYIKDSKNSEEYFIDGMIYLTSYFYDISPSNLKLLLKGEQYWLI